MSSQVEMTVNCSACGRAYQTTDALLESGKARCPFCGALHEYQKGFNWDRLGSSDEISPQVQEALLDLKQDLDAIRQLVEEPVDMMMKLLAEIQAQRAWRDEIIESWEALKLYIEARQTDITKEQLQSLMEGAEKTWSFE